MKNISKAKISLLRKREFTAIVMLMFLLVTNCAAISGGNIKLENYPEVKKGEVEKIDLSYENQTPRKYYGPNSIDSDNDFMEIVINSFKKNNIHEKTDELSKSKLCNVKVSTSVKWPIGLSCFINQYISGFTLAIIPYYCPEVYQTHATLISTSNNRILKEYDLKDKVHEVWSLFWALSWFVVNPTKYSNSDYPEEAKKTTEKTLSEALTRSILNDASNFEECQKK